MAIRDFWCYDNLPTYTGGGTSAAFQFLRPDATIIGMNTSTSIVKNSTGWLVGTGNNIPYPNTGYGNYNPFIQLPYQNLSTFSTRRSFIGMRFQINGNAYSTPILALINTAGTRQNLVLNTQLTINLSQFVEVMIDRANTQIVVWIDGVQVSSTFFDFNSFVAADGNALLQIGAYPNNYAIFNWQMRDNYFIDDTQDATQCARLGPVDIRPQPLAAATAPNWVSSDSGTPLSDLSTALGVTAATQTAPNLTEPASMDPVTVQFANTGLVAAESILAFRADFSAQRTPGYIFGPQVTAKFNGQTAQGKKLAYPTAGSLIWAQNGYLAETAPDGTAWTPAAIAATQVVMTP